MKGKKMSDYQKNAVNDSEDCPNPADEINLADHEFSKAEDSIDAPAFKIEHLVELISRGTISGHLYREIDGTLYIHEDIASILSEAYDDLAEEEACEDDEAEADEIAGDSESDIVSELEDHYKAAVEVEIDQLESSLYYYEKRLGMGYELDEETMKEYRTLLRDLEQRKMFFFGTE
jgi:hypothetical protein